MYSNGIKKIHLYTHNIHNYDLHCNTIKNNVIYYHVYLYIYYLALCNTVIHHSNKNTVTNMLIMIELQGITWVKQLKTWYMNYIDCMGDAVGGVWSWLAP